MGGDVSAFVHSEVVGALNQRVPRDGD